VSRPSFLALARVVGFVVVSLGALGGAGLVTACASAPPPAAPPPPPPIVEDGAAPAGGRLPTDVVPRRARLDLEIDPAAPTVKGGIAIDLTVAAPRRVLWLHGRELTIDKAAVLVDGKPRAARAIVADAAEGLLRLEVDGGVPAGPATLELSFTGPLRRDLKGLYRVDERGPDDVVDAYVFSQFEPLAAREAFPCFDEPGWKIPFTITLTHPAQVRAIGNTVTVRSDRLPDGRVRDRLAETSPLPTYLLAFVVGPVDVVDGPALAPSALRPALLQVRGVAPRGRGERLRAALTNAGAVLAAQEKAFGIGYPFDKLDLVAVPDFGAGAMENAGLVTFRDELLYVDDKSPIAEQKASLEVIAHELAHQWFGNLVTMAWWDDLWLNEAFASWFEARTVEQLRPDFRTALGLRESAHSVIAQDSLVSVRQIRQPITNRGDIDNAFDGITYNKGAAVIAMFEEYIDFTKQPGTFMSGVARYLRDHRFASGTAADFLAAISASAGFDVGGPFSTFLDQPGVPFVRASCAVDAGSAAVSFTSERFLPVGSTGEKNKQWDIPVCVSYTQGKTTKKACTLLLRGSGRVELSEKSCPAGLHPNADGGGYYRFTMPAPELQSLARALPTLTPGERLAFASAVDAGFDTASTPYRDALAAATALAGDAQASVLLAPWQLLAFARELVLQTDAARARVDAEIGRLYQPALNKLGFVDRPKDTAQDRERRAALFAVLVDASQAPLTLAVAAGRDVFATGSTSKVASDLWPTALQAAVAQGDIDEATWDAWLAAAKKQPDPRLRGQMLDALATARDARLADKALALVFDDDLAVDERSAGVWATADDRRTREAAFAFVTTRWDDIAARLPEDWRPGLVGTFGGFCSEADAARVEAFFQPKAATVPGLARELALTVEGIRLCATKKDLHAAGVRERFGEKVDG
jgi:alanyl aminopeptidase